MFGKPGFRPGSFAFLNLDLAASIRRAAIFLSGEEAMRLSARNLLPGTA